MGAFSVIVKTDGSFAALVVSRPSNVKGHTTQREEKHGTINCLWDLLSPICHHQQWGGRTGRGSSSKTWLFVRLGQVVLSLCLCGAEVNVRILYPIVLRWLHHTVATEWLQSADTHQRSYLLLFLPQTHSNVAFPPSTFGAWPRKLGIRNCSLTVFYVYRGWYLNIDTALPE